MIWLRFNNRQIMATSLCFFNLPRYLPIIRLLWVIVCWWFCTSKADKFDYASVMRLKNGGKPCVWLGPVLDRNGVFFKEVWRKFNAKRASNG